MKNDPHRKFCQRQHRLVGGFLANQAWLRGLECIVLTRSHLQYFFDLTRFKSARIKWLQEDFKPWFSYQKPYFKTASPTSIHSLFLARVPIDPHLPTGSMTTTERIRKMKGGAPRTELFLPNASTIDPPDEDEIVRSLTLLGAGLIAPEIYKAEHEEDAD